MTITTAEPAHAETVAEVLAHAFHDDPVVSWMVPDPVRRRAVMPRFFAVLVADAVKDGAVDVLRAADGEPLAAAAWFDQTQAPTGHSEPDHRLDDVLGADLPRWNALDAAMTEHHLRGPHHYLFAIGAIPPMQGRGLGASLLDHRHTRLGPEPAYLEATSRDSMRLYERKGYTLLGELRVPDGPTLWRMLRASEAAAPPG